MNSSNIELGEETFLSISDLITSYKVDLLHKKLDIYDIVSSYIESNQSEDPFFIVNIGDVIRQYNNWVQHLPTIRPYYAIKCNPDPLITRVLLRLGCGFDCASKNEISKALDIGCPPEDIIFANPCKMVKMIKYARAHDIDTVTFDSEHELYKLKLFHPYVKLVLRIITDDSHSVWQFSGKFGCNKKEAQRLMNVAKELELKIIGVSFHVGSNCKDPTAYPKAISDARELFDYGKEIGYDMTFLDIGGGFPGRDDKEVSFEMIAKKINGALDEKFGDWKDLSVIAEPGRYFATKSHILITNVIGKKVKQDPSTGEKVFIYYINDGVYDSFFNIPTDHFEVNEKNTFAFNERNEKKHKSKIFGPTCDNMDRISDSIMLPVLELGDYLIHTDMGAYSVAVSSGTESFNGFKRTMNMYVIN